MALEQRHCSALGALGWELLLGIAVHLHPREVEALWRAAGTDSADSFSDRLEQFCEATLRSRYGSHYAQQLFDAHATLEARGTSTSIRSWSWRLALCSTYLSHRWLFGISLHISFLHGDELCVEWPTEFDGVDMPPSNRIERRPWARLTVQRFGQRALDSVGNGALLAAVLSMPSREAAYRRSNMENALIVTPRRLLWFVTDPHPRSEMQLDVERSLFLTTALVLTATISDDQRWLVLGRRGCLLEVRDLLNWSIVAEGRLPLRIAKRDDFCCLDYEEGLVAAGTTGGRLLIFDCNQAPTKSEQNTTKRLKPIRMEFDTSCLPLSHVRLCRSHEQRHRPDLVAVSTKHHLRVYYLRLGLLIFQRDFERPICQVQTARSRTCIYIASGSTVDIIELPALGYAATLGRPSIMNESDLLTCVAVDDEGNVAGGWSSGHVTFWPARGRLVGIALTYHDRHLDLDKWRHVRQTARRDLSIDPGEVEGHPALAWGWSRSPIRSIYVDRDRVISASAAGIVEVFAHQQSCGGSSDGRDPLSIEDAIQQWQYCRTAWIAIPDLQGEIFHLSAGERTVLGGLCGDPASAQRMPLVLVRIVPLWHKSSEQVMRLKLDGKVADDSPPVGAATGTGAEACWLPPADVVRAFWSVETSEMKPATI